MRENIIIGIVLGLFFFMATAVVTAIAIKYATPSLLWDIILWSGVVGMICSVLTLTLFVYAQLHGRPFLGPALLINLGLCLIAGGFIWYFQTKKAASETTELDNKIQLNCEMVASSYYCAS